MKHIDPDIFHFWINSYLGKNYYSQYKHVEAGVNQDDCAIIRLDKEKKLIITTDYLNASPIALELGIGSFYDLGRITVASNISDLCGTGAQPIGFLLGIASGKETSPDNIVEFVKGVKYELDKLKIPLVGGDTKLGKSNSFYGVAVGFADNSRKLFPKNSAKENDILWVSGNTGSVSASVHGLSLNWGTDTWKKWATESVINPKLPIHLSKQLALSKIGNGGTDLSDGFGMDLLSLCKASNLGVHINADKLPANKNVQKLATHLLIPAWFYSIICGGDFQFLITTNKRHKSTMKKLGFHEIGLLRNISYGCKIEYKSQIFDIPNFGHQDVRGKNFSEEVAYLLEQLKVLFL